MEITSRRYIDVVSGPRGTVFTHSRLIYGNMYEFDVARENFSNGAINREGKIYSIRVYDADSNPLKVFGR